TVPNYAEHSTGEIHLFSVYRHSTSPLIAVSCLVTISGRSPRPHRMAVIALVAIGRRPTLFYLTGWPERIEIRLKALMATAIQAAADTWSGVRTEAISS